MITIPLFRVPSHKRPGLEHRLSDVRGYEGLSECTVCNCAEGTLPTHCPGVLVPYRVQNLIIKGVVDFVGDRWIGKRRDTFRISLQLTRGLGTTVEAFQNLSRAFARAGKSVADFGRAVPPQVTAEMAREALAHVPFDLSNPDRWEWLADFLNNAVRHPDVPCPCCNVTPAGDICDHLPPPKSADER
jgi:hypothetical protein